MSSRVLVTWECDRCGALDEGPDNYEPRGWRRIKHGSMTGTVWSQATICAACEEQFRSWWRPLDIDGSEAAP